MCFKCLINIPLNLLKHHLSNCGYTIVKNNNLIQQPDSACGDDSGETDDSGE